jgi:predicted nucleic acid-binding protein
VILADVNVLIYAHREDAADHPTFREWLESMMAALAIESGSEWITTDRDYARFAGLRWRHPF